MCECDFCKTRHLLAENLSDDKRKALYDLLCSLEDDLFSIVVKEGKSTQHLKIIYDLASELSVYFCEPFAKNKGSLLYNLLSTEN